MTAAGHRVVFDDAGSYIENKTTGEINMLYEENGNFIMDLWIMPKAHLVALVDAGFGGQP